MILEPGFNLTLRPMKYPAFYEMYRAAIRNTWTVEEVDFATDLVDLRENFGPGEQHLIRRLVAFFATGDSIVANNLVLNLYKHIVEKNYQKEIKEMFLVCLHPNNENQSFIRLAVPFLEDELAAALASRTNPP